MAPLLTVREVAALLGLSRSKVYLMALSGDLPVVRIGRSVRVSQDALASWLAQRSAQSA